MEPWFIKDTAFSQRLSQEELSLFLQICPTRPFGRGEVIFRMGDTAVSLHIIVEGQVKLVTPTSKGNERILAICGPQDFIGEGFLSGGEPYRADAVALTQVVTCPVSHEQFMALMDTVPHAVLTFAEVLAARLSHCYTQLTNTSEPVRQRVIKVLVEQAHRFGHPAEGGWYTLQTELGHDDIASMVSATRVSVTTTVVELRERGLLEGTRGEYRLNIPALESLVE